MMSTSNRILFDMVDIIRIRIEFDQKYENKYDIGDVRIQSVFIPINTNAYMCVHYCHGTDVPRPCHDAVGWHNTITSESRMCNLQVLRHG